MIRYWSTKEITTTRPRTIRRNIKEHNIFYKTIQALGVRRDLGRLTSPQTTRRFGRVSRVPSGVGGKITWNIIIIVPDVAANPGPHARLDEQIYSKQSNFTRDAKLDQPILVAAKKRYFDK